MRRPRIAGSQEYENERIKPKGNKQEKLDAHNQRKVFQRPTDHRAQQVRTIGLIKIRLPLDQVFEHQTGKIDRAQKDQHGQKSLQKSRIDLDDGQDKPIGSDRIAQYFKSRNQGPRGHTPRTAQPNELVLTGRIQIECAPQQRTAKDAQPKNDEDELPKPDVVTNRERAGTQAEESRDQNKIAVIGNDPDARPHPADQRQFPKQRRRATKQ